MGDVVPLRFTAMPAMCLDLAELRRESELLFASATVREIRRRDAPGRP
jgi:hypothetical protein